MEIKQVISSKSVACFSYAKQDASQESSTQSQEEGRGSEAAA